MSPHERGWAHEFGLPVSSRTPHNFSLIATHQEAEQQCLTLGQIGLTHL